VEGHLDQMTELFPYNFSTFNENINCLQSGEACAMSAIVELQNACLSFTIYIPYHQSLNWPVILFPTFPKSAA